MFWQQLNHRLSTARTQIARIEHAIEALTSIPPPPPPKDGPPAIPPKSSHGHHSHQHHGDASSSSQHTHGRASSVSSHTSSSTAPTSVTGSPAHVGHLPAIASSHLLTYMHNRKLAPVAPDEAYVFIENGSPVRANPRRESAGMGVRNLMEPAESGALPALLAGVGAALDGCEAEVTRLAKWTRVSRDTAKAARRTLVG